MNASTHSLPLASAYFAHAPSKNASLSQILRSPRSSLTISRQPAVELSTFNTSADQTATDLPTPTTTEALPILPKRLALYRAALYWLMFVEGWNDSTAGPLIPVIRRTYGLNFTIVSMLFVTSAIGFAVGALLNIHLTDRYGLGKVITACAIIQMVAYTLIAAALPFPVMCFGYGLCGLTMALHNAQCNIFTAMLPGNGTSAMGLLHGFYGIGAMAAPLAATQFAQLQHWSYFYFISLGLATFSFASSLYAFRLQRMEDLLPQASGDIADSEPLVRGNKYKQILSQKQVHLLAAFTLVYVGAEVTIGGWIVTFLDQLRGGGPSAGYVSSGFFGGITVGRFILWPVTDWIGKRRSIYIYGVLAIIFEIIVWRVPNLLTDAVAVALVGLVLGPLYPIVMNVSAEVLPRWILAGSIGFVASLGQMGSALFPFLTGLLATSHGVEVLQPLVIGLLGFMMANWALFLFHTGGRRTD
ncbi:hypothetical protein FRB95_004754 [Tulasnella sp. JGI-2019a]|nr:hypothetical protein FRB95_004754 [Tulasnella sp. JGI-2019a]